MDGEHEGRTRRRGRRKKKTVTITELLGFALGCVRLSLDDFERLTPEEFSSICKAYREQCESDYKDNWERMRMQAAITIQPHIKSKLTPQKLLPFPWEQRKKRQPKISQAEAEKRFEKLMARKNNGEGR